MFLAIHPSYTTRLPGTFISPLRRKILRNSSYKNSVVNQGNTGTPRCGTAIDLDAKTGWRNGTYTIMITTAVSNTRPPLLYMFVIPCIPNDNVRVFVTIRSAQCLWCVTNLCTCFCWDSVVIRSSARLAFYPSTLAPGFCITTCVEKTQIDRPLSCFRPIERH